MRGDGARPALLIAALLFSPAVVGGPAFADVDGCRAVESFGVFPPPAALTWKPFLKKRRTVAPAGLLAAQLPTLAAALHAIEAARRDPSRRPEAFLARPFLQGFIVYDYQFPEGSGFSLGQVTVTDFPFGGTAEIPEAWLVDAGGRTGTLLRDEGTYRLVRLGRDETDRLVPEPSAAKSFRLGRDPFRVDEPPAVDDGLPWIVPDGLENVAGESWNPRFAFRPGLDEAGLVRLLKWLNGQPASLKVKAGGSRHSWSKVAASDGAYIHPQGMSCLEGAAEDGALRTDLPESLRSKLFRIGSGTVVREISETLWEKFGKAAGVLGGYDGQTLGGVLPTGTHGSVLSHGPLAEVVRSLDLVAGTGEPLRIEPCAGPTDPEAFARLRPGARLIQDDETFDAALIHLGAMGVVRSLVVEVRDRFFLNEVRTRFPVEELFGRLAGGAIYHRFSGVDAPGWSGPDRGEGFAKHPAKAYHLEFLFNPLGADVLVTSRQPTPLPGGEPPYFHERPEKNLFRLAGIPKRHRRVFFPTWVSENFPDAIGWLSEEMTQNIPSLTPRFVSDAMRGLSDDGYLHRSYRVFNIGDGQNAIPSLSGTIFVPLRDDLYLRAVEILRRVAREEAKKGIYQTGPISLRFVKGSRAMLASPEDVGSFELIFAGRPEHATDLIRAYDAALRAELGDENVRFHWGQLMPGADPERIRAGFPRFGAWRRIRDRLDPAGRFVNAWQETILPRDSRREASP